MCASFLPNDDVSLQLIWRVSGIYILAILERRGNVVQIENREEFEGRLNEKRKGKGGKEEKRKD